MMINFDYSFDFGILGYNYNIDLLINDIVCISS